MSRAKVVVYVLVGFSGLVNLGSALVAHHWSEANAWFAATCWFGVAWLQNGDYRKGYNAGVKATADRINRNYLLWRKQDVA